MVLIPGSPPLKQKTRNFTHLSKGRTGLFLEPTEALGNGRTMISKSREKSRHMLWKTLVRDFQKQGKLLCTNKSLKVLLALSSVTRLRYP